MKIHKVTNRQISFHAGVDVLGWDEIQALMIVISGIIGIWLGYWLAVALGILHA